MSVGDVVAAGLVNTVPQATSTTVAAHFVVQQEVAS
jgi:hypothetical protein